MAWFRTGLATIAGALTVGRVIPALLSGSHVVYVILGLGYAALGAFMIVYGFVRAQRIDLALDANSSVVPNGVVVVVVTIVTLALVVATVVVVMMAV